MKTTIYAVTHRNLSEKEIKKLKNRTILKVSSVYENDGRQNINDKNYKYCELTGLYDILANDKESDIIGFEHYRRTFSKSLCRRSSIKQSEIEKILTNYTVILPKPVKLKYTNLEFYRKNHYFEDIHLLREALVALYPEVVKTYDEVMQERSFSSYNMFITTMPEAKKYGTFLFKITHWLEDKINVDERDGLQKRVFGFLGERINYIYHLHYHKDKIKYLYVNNLEETGLTNFKRKRKHILE